MDKKAFYGRINDKEFTNAEDMMNYIREISDVKETNNVEHHDYNNFFAEMMKDLYSPRFKAFMDWLGGDEEDDPTPKEITAPKPYKDIESYVVPTIAEIEHTAGIVDEEGEEALKRIDKNLEDRAKFLANVIAEKNGEDLKKFMDKISKVADENNYYLDSKIAETIYAIENTEKQLEVERGRMTLYKLIRNYMNGVLLK